MDCMCWAISTCAASSGGVNQRGSVWTTSTPASESCLLVFPCNRVVEVHTLMFCKLERGLERTECESVFNVIRTVPQTSPGPVSSCHVVHSACWGRGPGLENMLLMIMKLFDNSNLRDFAYMSLRISSGIKQCLF